MNAILRSIIVVIFFACAPALAEAEAEDFTNGESLGRWITYYYLKPEPHRVADAIHAASSQGFMKGGKKAPLFIGFLAGVLSKNPSLVQSLSKQLTSLPVVDQPTLILGVWYSSHPEAKKLLLQLAKAMPKHKEMIDYLVSNDRLGLLDLPLEQGAWVLDTHWGYFMATGDDAPVIRIISALPWVNIRGDTSRLLVGGSARWSLISNAIQHKPVMAICRRELDSPKNQANEVLRAVIEEAEKDMKAGKTG